MLIGIKMDKILVFTRKGPLTSRELAKIASMINDRKGISLFVAFIGCREYNIFFWRRMNKM